MEIPAFVLTSNSRKLQPKREHFFNLCDSARAPFITVTPKRRYSVVTLDMITCGRALTDQQQNRVERLFEEFGEDGERLFINEWYCWYGRVPKDCAELLAAELFRVANSS